MHQLHDMSTESVCFFSQMTDPVTKPRQPAAGWIVAGSSCVSKKQGGSLEQAEERLVLIYTWQRERGESLGPHWSYAVLCDKVAQVFLSMNFRKEMNLSHAACTLLCCLSPYLYLSPLLVFILLLPSAYKRWTAADNKSHPSFPIPLLSGTIGRLFVSSLFSRKSRRSN